MILLCKRQKTLFIHCSCTVYGSHNTIHTFKNYYFTTVFSVFSFSNNKSNSNGPMRDYLNQGKIIIELINSLWLKIGLIVQPGRNHTEKKKDPIRVKLIGRRKQYGWDFIIIIIIIGFGFCPTASVSGQKLSALLFWD